MNIAFNNLSKENQHQILGLDNIQRKSVMDEIIRKSSEVDKSNYILGGAFEALPVDKKLVALHGGYTSMAKDFGGLAKTAPLMSSKFHRTEPIYNQLAGKLPLLSIEDKTPTSDNHDNIESTVATNSSPSSEGGTIKRITI